MCISVHPTLRKLIEDGQKQIDALEDVTERKALAAKLHADLCSRFLPGDVEFDDESLHEEGSVEQEWQDHLDHEDAKDASDFATEGCYGDDDGGNEPRIRGLMKPPTGAQDSEIIQGAPDLTADRLATHDAVSGNLRTGTDSVSQGEIWSDEMSEKAGGISKQSGLFTRMSRGKGRWRIGRGQGQSPFKNHLKTCELCQRRFEGSKNARFCNVCKAPQFAAMRKRLREITEAP
jgi:hypothetical protein